MQRSTVDRSEIISSVNILLQIELVIEDGGCNWKFAICVKLKMNQRNVTNGGRATHCKSVYSIPFCQSTRVCIMKGNLGFSIFTAIHNKANGCSKIPVSAFSAWMLQMSRTATIRCSTTMLNVSGNNRNSQKFQKRTESKNDLTLGILCLFIHLRFSVM